MKVNRDLIYTKKGAMVLMKKKIVILGLVFGLSINVTACSLPVFNNKNDDKKVQKEETSDESKEENLYSPILADDVKIPNVEYPYILKVNKAHNCMTVYTLDSEEEYTTAVRSMICSTGGNDTPDGTFQLGDSVEWQMLADGNYGRYVTRVVDDVVIRSVDYYAQSEDSLNASSYNSLGDTVSGSSIVLGDADAQWIAQNCPEGTKIEIFSDDKEEEPLGKPLARLIPENVKWDPTDPSTENAWYVPVSFKGIADKVVKVGEIPELLAGVTAKDKYCNDLTTAIKVYGEVDVNKPGEYEITYSCENTEGNKRDVVINVKVVEDDSQENENNSAEEASVSPSPTTAPTQSPAQENEQTKAPNVTTEVANASTTAPAPTEKTSTVTTITTVSIIDEEPPKVGFVADSSRVSSLSNSYLLNRIYAYDVDSGIEGIYISTCRVSDDGAYIIVYEVFDNAGNSTCVSETVYLN